jgi:hypothetical protein
LRNAQKPVRDQAIVTAELRLSIEDVYLVIFLHAFPVVGWGWTVGCCAYGTAGVANRFAAHPLS